MINYDTSVAFSITHSGSEMSFSADSDLGRSTKATELTLALMNPLCHDFCFFYIWSVTLIEVDIRGINSNNNDSGCGILNIRF